MSPFSRCLTTATVAATQAITVPLPLGDRSLAVKHGQLPAPVWHTHTFPWRHGAMFCVWKGEREVGAQWASLWPGHSPAVLQKVPREIMSIW